MVNRNPRINLKGRVTFIVAAENLQANTQVKTYKEMCKLLGEEEKTSNSKRAQLKEWARYFKFKRDGHKFIIEEIYKSPRPKLIRQGAATAHLLEELLLSDPVMFGDNGRVFTKIDLLQLLHIVPDEYINIHKLEESYLNQHSEEDCIRKIVMKEFSLYCSMYFKRILTDALKSMNRRGLIYFKETYQILVGSKEYFLADETQIRKIKKADSETLVDMNMESMKQVIFKWKLQEFYQKRANVLYSEYGWTNAYNVVLINSYVPMKVMSAGERDRLRIELNDHAIESIRDWCKQKVEEANRERKNPQPPVDGVDFDPLGLRRKHSFRLQYSWVGKSYEEEIEDLINNYVRLKEDISHIYIP